jgi:hypothetical protein
MTAETMADAARESGSSIDAGDAGNSRKTESAQPSAAMSSKKRLNLNEEEIYRRVMMRVEALMKLDPELGSRDGIELDHLTAAVELYERRRWPVETAGHSGLPTLTHIGTAESRDGMYGASDRCEHKHPDRQPTDTYCRDCGELL